MSYPHPPSHASDPEGAVVNHVGLNALAPISRIPSEILVIIFFHVRDDELPGYIRPYQHDRSAVTVPTRKTALGWIGVTHVCSYWRDVAIQACSLWSYIPLTWNSKWMRTILMRSQSVSLSILTSNEGISEDLIPHAICAIHEHVYHIQSLHISTPDPVTMETLFSKLLEPAPLLKSVTFVVFEDWGPYVSRIPSELFNGNALALNKLSLVNCTAPWNSPNFYSLVRNLSSLNIVFPLDDFVFPVLNPPFRAGVQRRTLIPSLTQLLDLLRFAPRLEYLALDNILPECPAGVHCNAVSLPNLRTCRLGGDSFDCVCVARHIRPSHNAYLDLDITSNPDDEAECYAAIAAVLEDHVSFRKQSTPTLSRIQVKVDLGSYSLVINSDLYRVLLSDVGWTPCRDDFTRKCLASLHLFAPTTLSFRHWWTTAQRPDLVHVFSTDSLHSTTEVVLEHANGVGLQYLCDALCERSEPDIYPPEQAVRQGAFHIFPELQTLSLKQISLEESEDGPIPSLRRAVALRKEFGRPIKKLELHSCCQVDSRWLEELHSIPGLKITCSDEA